MRRQERFLALVAFGAFISGWRILSLFSGRSLSLLSSKSVSRTVKGSRTLTLLVPLSGELGNHLHWISTAFRIKWDLEQRFPLNIQVVGEHQDNPKWKNAHKDILSCFVNLKDFVFDAGRHSAEFRRIRAQQRDFVQNYPGEFAISATGADCNNLFECAHRRAELVIERWRTIDQNREEGNILQAKDSKYSLPFLVLREMDGPSINHDTEPIRALFTIDSTSPICCALLPNPSELVFHLRHFGVESNGRLTARDVGFDELSPDQVVPFLSNELEVGGSIAIVSRFPDHNFTLSYQKALMDAGYRTRIIKEQTGIQDFCFMLQSQHELVGLLTSTYVWWAAELGNMSATLYSKAVRNDTTFKDFMKAQEPHRWRFSGTGSRIRHVPDVPMN
jgi:DNA-directed RNA polymerase subunit L